jgi:SAM-dependent methyltransferase
VSVFNALRPSHPIPKDLNLYRTIRHIGWRLLNKPFAAREHVTRFSMYRHLESVATRIPKIPDPRVLAISGSKNLAETLDLRPREIVEADYPDINMLSLPYPDATFDYVLSDQVLEHLAGNPFDAIAQCYRVLRPGGLALHTTCLNMHIHEATPGVPHSDFWRFTPDGLALLHRNWSEVLEVGGWGNLDVWNVVAKDGMRWRGVPSVKWHPFYRIATRNDPAWPIVTWVIARK